MTGFWEMRWIPRGRLNSWVVGTLAQWLRGRRPFTIIADGIVF